ncbi:ABC-2 type transport system ATP-binding protein [Aequitasia blattaphilus]|uniref:ABC transporter ATP-binding protein n=1 Tax=Aequitasia blattaphilus TaxID=2949332 RepID=A0ABT1EEV5_9FIRM|nr:ABC transporter ATP-binding protein [Aequitasia blattaphilus]MCP1103472.1 ABC transporter ATP-binding protein [Aequitasia blattaphilus]MCR8616112.1 ABC transporter ATP-binding protein [Aequitasia blattaphilus]
MNKILECIELTKKYANNFCAINQLNLTLYSGQIVGLLGPNGSGKTTLIKMINDCLIPTGGIIYVNGNPVGIHSKEDISYLPDVLSLDEHLKVEELVTYFNDFYKNFNPVKAHQMILDLGINPSSRLRTLSKGTKEKVQLILTMSRDAKLFILDEPIGGVDPASRDYILHTILSNYNPDATVLISTHLIGEIENIIDRVLFLQNGQIILNSTVDEVREQHHKSVDQLFREVFRC